MPRLRPHPEDRKAAEGKRRAATSGKRKPRNNGPVIGSNVGLLITERKKSIEPIADRIALWQLTMKCRDGEDQRTVLGKAAVDLFTLLRVDATVQPEKLTPPPGRQSPPRSLTWRKISPADEARHILSRPNRAGLMVTAGRKKRNRRRPPQADITVAEASPQALPGEEFCRHSDRWPP